LGRLGFRALKGAFLSIFWLFFAIFCPFGVGFSGFSAQQGPLEPSAQTVARPKANSHSQSSGATAASAQTSASQPAPPPAVPFKPESSATSAQDETPLFRSDVRLVRMLATVRDGSGQLAGNLTRNDFLITDNGVAQEVAVFEATTERPLSVALLIDCSRSTQREHRTELDSVRTFVRALFHAGNPGDAATLYSFNADVTLEASWTRSSERIERALNRLHSEGATALYDAINFGAQDLKSRDGRHVAVIVSDGGNTFGKTTYMQALESAHAADAIVYAVIIVPVAEEPGRNTGGEHALTSLSTSTGGRTFSPGTAKDLDRAFEEILRDLRTQYLIGYYPHGMSATHERFHEVKLNLRRPGYTVSTRRGYFEPSPSRGFRAVTR
jgi:Ca-activated chloride channel family protein